MGQGTSLYALQLRIPSHLLLTLVGYVVFPLLGCEVDISVRCFCVKIYWSRIPKMRILIGQGLTQSLVIRVWDVKLCSLFLPRIFSQWFPTPKFPR